jgi:hypothetical protein
VRGVSVAVVAVMVLAAASVAAAPLPPKSGPVELGTKSGPVELGTAPSVDLVRDSCGRGWHRTRWRDQWGYWRRGDCVPEEGRAYGGYGAGWYYPYSVWRGAPQPWGWGYPY